MLDNAPTPVVAYIRVSTTEQSVRRQRGDLADDVVTYGLVVTRTLDNDEGISASLYGTKVRTDYEALVVLISSGQVDGQVIWLSDASRLSRNVESFGPLRKLCRQHRVRWWIKGRIYDLNKADDLGTVTDMIVAAERESLAKSDLIRSGMRDQIREGRPPSHTPYGYRRVYDTTKPRKRDRFQRQEADPITGPIVTELARSYAAGKSPTEIARDLNAREVTPPGTVAWTGRAVVRIATGVVYTGRRRYRGEQPALMGTHVGKWPTLIDEVTHMSAVNRAESARKGYTPRKAENLLVGVAHCWRCPRGQRSPVGYIRAVDRDGRRVYGCLMGCVRLPQVDVDTVVLAVLAKWFIKPDFGTIFAPGDSAELVAARNRLAVAELAWEELADAPISPALLARREPPLLAGIESAKTAVAELTRPAMLAALADAEPERRMAVFTDLDLSVKRQVVAELLDVTLRPRGPAGRTRPVEDFVDVQQLR